jgi:hypothetical protein
MTVGEVLGWATSLLTSMGLMPFITATLIVSIALFAVRAIFNRD